jgi:ATP-dependent DNA helicase RecQ
MIVWATMSGPPPSPEQTREGLIRHFGLDDFRPGQSDVVNAVMAGRNAVVVMPTGAGKSLCYQLPATLLPGVTLVVSPLIALMKDQVEQLTARGIEATFINSTLSDTERAERQRRLAAGGYKLVYVAPERFRSGAFFDALTTAGVALFAVDEAHCISQWGHDFRPDYAQLGKVRKRLRPPRTVALTATATPEVREDIVKSLLMKDPQVFAAGFDRPNLILEVQPVSGDDDKKSAVADLVREGGSGIVYCSTRKAAETIFASLERNRRAVLYHAGMDDDARRRAQDLFMSTPDAVAVATNAFGMGIDKADLRFVVHANIPRAVEAYYQEIGRAGRDGKPSRAVLLFNHSDVYTHERMIEGNHPGETLFAEVWSALQSADELTLGMKALSDRVEASEFELAAVLRVLERTGKVGRGSRLEGPYGITLLPRASALEPADAGARAVLISLLGSFPISRPVQTEAALLARRTELPEAQVRQALAQLERAGAIELRRPFAGRTLRAMERGPWQAQGIDFGRLEEQQRRALLLLRRMTDYAYATSCRRRFLLRYFGE